MGQKTAGITVLSYFIKTKSQCIDYETLKTILEKEGYQPEGVYSYVRYYVKKGYLETRQMSRRKIICIKENVRRDLQIMLRIYEKEPK